MDKKLMMRYFSPAENTNEGWEKYSMPIGNGYFGANVFGGTDTERIQFTTNEFCNDYSRGGLSNFGEMFINFNHIAVGKYERGLSLDTGVARSSYIVDGVKIHREAFVSYPDKVFAYKITAQNGSVDFNAELYIPYLGERSVEDGGRTGETTADGNVLVMRGTLPSRELIYEARLTVVSDGETSVKDNKIIVQHATKAELFYTLGTSYKLCAETFLDTCQKAIGVDPHDEVVKCLDNAASLGWDNLYARHISDYTELIGRVKFDLGGVDDGRSTEELLQSYKDGNNEPYLEELYYAYGRHLLVSSSRKGTLPAALQGVWNVHDKAPWSGGFWHNINVQMNYWPAFNTNLAETFEAYAGYWESYLKQASVNASKFIKQHMPENYVEGEGECGWIVGTGAWAFRTSSAGRNGHTGPGTGGLTSKMFWDYYDFTRDENVLRNYTYPAVHGMSKFLTKCVCDYDGRYLCKYSASPEQILSGWYVNSHKQQQYYQTVGCAFDQQLIYENAVDDIKCSELLGIEDETTKIERQQFDGYGPVQIGYSGQVKEYDEEHFYGEIGQEHHRHISQLMSLSPGNTITHKTPAWLDAARLTLKMRGDHSTGWALAHRFNGWARVGDGNRAYTLLQNLLRECTHPNLWDVHPPFQIDGNFGALAGMTEMVLQSHEGYLSLLPAIPDSWGKISFKGLKARGNFTVDCEYSNGLVNYCKIKSIVGEKVILCYEGISNSTTVRKLDGSVVEFKQNGSFIEFDTEKDETYMVENFGVVNKRDIVVDLSTKWTDGGVSLHWSSNGKKCAIYRACENDSDYVLLAETSDGVFVDNTYNRQNKARLTYKIVMCDGNYSASSDGAIAVVHPASKLEEERYYLRYMVNNHLYGLY